ncbi:universal stress protein [Fodinicurvata sp. EGI_FJ10296]|uniref:universal stress protein n=1 Tax=Fodinicurvata sp. EGI_FJ10296 TaxID=3231908 RepID=UPI00345185F6
MAYKTLLVHVDNTKQSRGRIAAAAEIARRNDAHIVGLGIRVPMPLPAYAGPSIAPVFIPIMDDDGDEQIDEAKALFDQVMDQEGLTGSSEWRAAGGDAAHVLDIHSRYADLVVVGQTDYDLTPSSVWDLPDNLVLESTRPVLIVPHIGPRATIGKTITVAWDGGRAAASAVYAALPLLKRADQVQILTVRASDTTKRWPGMDVAAYLARHGANVTASRFDGSEMSIDDVLLNSVSDTGADMVVMGAYGHSRFRETVLGGTTRNILKHMTVPTLMAH